MKLKAFFQDLKGRLSMRIRGHRTQLLTSLLSNDIELLEAQTRQWELLAELREQGAALDSLPVLEKHLQQLSQLLDNIHADQLRTHIRLDEVEAQLCRLSASASLHSFRVSEHVASRHMAHAPETHVLASLFPFMEHSVAVDVGAYHGEFSRALLDAGYHVHAIEPYPPSVRILREHLGSEPGFTLHALAISDVDGPHAFHLVVMPEEECPNAESSLYHRLEKCELPAGLHLADSIEVRTARLDSLWQQGTLPSDLGVLKLDAEGMDLRILSSLPDQRISVVMAEFYEIGNVFHPAEEESQLHQMISLMRKKGYSWHIVFRYQAVPGLEDAYDVTAELCQPAKGDDSWGNVVFFASYELYAVARDYCRSTGNALNV